MIKTCFDINGFLLINKPASVTSHKVLYPIKKLLPKNTKVGHTGTLDPNATGLLVVAIGRATKFINHLEKSSKIYEASLRFGAISDTLDIWGDVSYLEQDEICLDEFKRAISDFIGEVMQVPPMYSAIKKNGVPLYKFARKGIEVERKARKIRINSIGIIAYNYPEAIIRIECSKGTYIRTLISDIASALGASAVMTSLKRLKSDYFYLDKAVEISDIKSVEDISSHLVHLDDCFAHLDKIEVDSVHAAHIKNGVKVNLIRFCDYKRSDLYYSVYSQQFFIGIARWKDDGIFIVTKF